MELEWDAIKTGSKSDQTPYIALKSGENRVRVVSKPFKLSLHWEKSVLDGKIKRVVCPGAGCPLCKANHAPQQRFQVLAINREVQDKTSIEILEGGTSIFGSIRQFAVDPEYGDPSQYDIKIMKEGTGRETKYTVMASPRLTPLTPAELTAIDASRSLIEISKPHSIEDILGMGLEALATSMADLSAPDDDWDTTVSTPAPAGTKDDINDDEWSNL